MASPLEHFDNPHNEYLAILSNNGLPALLFYLGLLNSIIVRGIRRKRYELAIPIVLFAIQGFCSFSICLVSPIFWAILGMTAENQT